MTDALLTALLGGIFALVVAALSNAVQIWLYRKDQKKRASDEILARRRQVISDLIACRTALCKTPDQLDHLLTPYASMSPDRINFNIALNRIPVEFHNQEILTLYKEIGDGFNEIKFYDLMEALWQATFNKAFPIPISLLSNVPAARSGSHM